MTFEELVSKIQKEHQIFSATRCTCGWQGGSPIIHIIDLLGLEEVGLIHQTCNPDACPHFGLAVNS